MYQSALEIDENNAEAKQGVQFCMNALRNQAPEERLVIATIVTMVAWWHNSLPWWPNIFTMMS